VNDLAAELKATRQDDSNIADATRKNVFNLLWEFTQALLAISLTFATIYSSLRFGDTNTVMTPDGTTISVPVPETLKNALFVVLGFYFGRTNHARPPQGA
jgi:hypothetical protein